MTKNMGTTDRVIRTLVAVAIAVLYFTGTIGGTLAIVLGIVAVAFLVTSLVGWCPSYLPFGVSTRKSAPAGESGQAARR
ncbi:MAG: YgaP family membrane protein [Gemmatimonadales bacterium]